MPSRSAITRFKLSDLPPDRRRTELHELIAPMMGVQFEGTDRDFEICGEIISLPGVSIVRGVNSPAMVRSLVGTGSDELMLGWSLKPWLGEGSQLGRSIDGGARIGVLASLADPFQTRLESDYHPVQVRILRSDLLALVPHAEESLMKPVRWEDPSFSLLRCYLEALWTYGLPDTPEGVRTVALHIQDLVALVIGGPAHRRGELGNGGLAAARMSAAKKFISSNLTDPSLTIVGVARDQHIGVRRLQHLFELEGTTFTQFVQSERLALVHRLLMDPLYGHKSISEIAFASGFNDLSHFNRSFRARFDASPGDIRQADRRH